MIAFAPKSVLRETREAGNHSSPEEGRARLSQKHIECVYIYIYIYICIYLSIYLSIYVYPEEGRTKRARLSQKGKDRLPARCTRCVLPDMCIYLSLSLYIYIYTLYTYIYIYYIHTHVCTHMCIRITQTYVYMHVCIYVCMYVYIYIYIHISVAILAQVTMNILGISVYFLVCLATSLARAFDSPVLALCAPLANYLTGIVATSRSSCSSWPPSAREGAS